MLVCFTIPLQDKAEQASKYYKFRNEYAVSFYVKGKNAEIYPYKGTYKDNYYKTQDNLDYYLDGHIEINTLWHKKEVSNVSSYQNALGDNEILISKDIGEKENVQIGDSFALFEHDLKVVGYLNDQYQFSNTVFMNDNTYNILNNITLENYFYIDYLGKDERVYPFIKVNKFSDISEDYTGNAPQNSNEIILPSKMVNSLGYTAADIINKTIDIDLEYSAKDSTKYGTFEKVSFKVVGVSQNNIYIKDDAINNYKKYNSYLMDNECAGYGIINPKESDFRTAFSQGLVDKSAASSNFEMAVEYYNSWIPVASVVGTVLAVISLFMITAMVFNSVSVNTKELGILVSLDYSKKWRFMIFLSEIVIIVLTSFILSLPLSAVGISWLNKSAFSGYGLDEAYNLLLFTWKAPVILLLVSALISFILCFFTNLKLNKKSDINLIYGK